MKVTLIDYTGKGNPDPLYAARLLTYTKSTRLEQGYSARARIASMPTVQLMEELKYIANTIRSSWEFVDYTFEITGVTRAFTHQFVRTRTGSYAQQSQRTLSMEGGFEAEMPEAFKGTSVETCWNNLMGDIQGVYNFAIKEGFSPQDARAALPTAIHTNIIAKFNLRTMADMIPKRENIRAQNEYVEVARLMGEAMLEVHPWVKPFLWPERKDTPCIEKILRDMIGTACPAELPNVNAALKELDKLKEVWG